MKKIIALGLILLMSGCVQNSVFSRCPNGYSIKKDMEIVDNTRAYVINCENNSNGHNAVFIMSNMDFSKLSELEGYKTSSKNRTVTVSDCNDYSCYIDIKNDTK